MTISQEFPEQNNAPLEMFNSIEEDGRKVSEGDTIYVQNKKGILKEITVGGLYKNKHGTFMYGRREDRNVAFPTEKASFSQNAKLTDGSNYKPETDLTHTTTMPMQENPPKEASRINKKTPRVEGKDEVVPRQSNFNTYTSLVEGDRKLSVGDRVPLKYLGVKSAQFKKINQEGGFRIAGFTKENRENYVLVDIEDGGEPIKIPAITSDFGFTDEARVVGRKETTQKETRPLITATEKDVDIQADPAAAAASIEKIKKINESLIQEHIDEITPTPEMILMQEIDQIKQEMAARAIEIQEIKALIKELQREEAQKNTNSENEQGTTTTSAPAPLVESSPSGVIAETSTITHGDLEASKKTPTSVTEETTQAVETEEQIVKKLEEKKEAIIQKASVALEQLQLRADRFVTSEEIFRATLVPKDALDAFSKAHWESTMSPGNINFDEARSMLENAGVEPGILILFDRAKEYYITQRDSIAAARTKIIDERDQELQKIRHTFDSMLENKQKENTDSDTIQKSPVDKEFIASIENLTGKYPAKKGNKKKGKGGRA